MSWMTLVCGATADLLGSGDCGAADRGTASRWAADRWAADRWAADRWALEELGDPVTALVEPVQRQAELPQLDPLLHAGRVAADLPVPLLVEPDVTQRLGGALAGRVGGQAAHPCHVRHELGGRHLGRQAVVLRHVADPRPDVGRLRCRVEPEHPQLST